MMRTKGMAARLRRGVGLAVLAGPVVLWSGSGSPVAAQASPLTLEQAVEQALESSPVVQAARLAAEASDHRVGVARSRLLPRANLSLGYTRNLTAPATFLPAMLLDPEAPAGELFRVPLGADNVWNSAVVVEQSVLDVGSVAALRASNRSAALQDEVAREQTHEVVANVRTLYYDLLLAGDRVRLTERSLERVRTSLRQVEALRQEGLASEYDVLRLEVEVGTLEPALRRARNAQREAARQLLLAMGAEGDGEALDVAGSLVAMCLLEPEANEPADRAILQFTGVDPGELDAAQLRSAAWRASPGLRRLELEADVRRAEVRAQQAEFFPRITLFGAYDIQAQQDGAPAFFGQSGQRGYGRVAGVRVTVPLFTGLQRLARVGEANARLEQAQVVRAAEAERTAARLATLLEQVGEAMKETGGQRLAVERATRGREIVASRFAEGLSSRLELMDAEVALRETQANYAEAVHGYLVARARVDALLGEAPSGVGGLQ